MGNAFRSIVTEDIALCLCYIEIWLLGFTVYPLDVVSEVIIPEQIDDLPVTVIGDYAFYNCTALSSVTIPDSITSIGHWAFGECTGLTSVTLPKSVTSIGVSTFDGCRNLEAITIPDSVTSIGRNAFSNTAWLESQRRISPLVIVNNILTDGRTCTGDVEIPDGVISIGDYSFYNCIGLTSIKIPQSVTKIGHWAFGNCQSLSSAEIPDSVTSIGDCTFYQCISLKSITIPDSISTIGEAMFYECAELNSIVIPDNITSISEWAFCNCTGLTSITIFNPECVIFDSEYTITDSAKICGFENSTAQNYAVKYRRNFEIIKESLMGDSDLDGKVGISDVVKVMMYVANKEANPLSEQGLINADVYSSGDGVFISDALSIQKKVAQIIDTLPEN
ncbi:MAG: leucine-rich repeat protein [Ruminococcus sp.]